MADTTLKNNITEIMSKGSSYNLVAFMRAIAKCNKITYGNELRFISSKLDRIARYQGKYYSRLNAKISSQKKQKKKVNVLQKKLSSSKLAKQKKNLLEKELKSEQKKLELLDAEVNKLNKASQLLEEMGVDSKERLSEIKRKLARSKMNVGPVKKQR